MNEAHLREDEFDDLPPIEDDIELEGEGSMDAELRTGHLSMSRPRGAGQGGSAQEPWNAAGACVIRATDAGARIAVLESGGLVSLPKAEVGPGESAETAATRAAEAFTGRKVKLVETLGETEEWIEGEPMATWFWLARPTRAAGLDLVAPPPAGFTLHWLDLEEAAQALSSDGERSLVTRLLSQPLPAKKLAFASPEHRHLAQDLEAFRDDSVALARGAQDPEQLEALLRARDEIERAEERLTRGDVAGARRARARAERETLGALDDEGRSVAFRRALDRAPEHLRPALAAAAPVNGGPVSVDVLLAVHSAVETALEDEARKQDARRTAQTHATIALGATAAAVLIAAAAGLFKTAPRPVLDTVGAALVFLTAGLLGGWVGEALFSLREERGQRRLSLPMAAAAGALAGLAVGAVLSSGFETLMVEDAALSVAATFAAGWLVRTVLPRGA
ncbi:hypothetical protein Poly30_35930 [Planctomycetes bacterium Poly30]|uniref:Nudix hydrolase domain-containing protein n=1 Tax=Saltatorellus ferox TaxID=2528018 RepID=A0A518EVF5_9BACT|nr:hypothetical protein Poly30_35930 [Planctomycetes bacterium Poly30]